MKFNHETGNFWTRPNEDDERRSIKSLVWVAYLLGFVRPTFWSNFKEPWRKWPLPPPPPRPRKISIIEWPCDGYWPTHRGSGKEWWAATMCYTRPHSKPWLAFQTAAAMIAPRTGLENHVTAVTIVCYGHHDQCGLDFHPLHTSVFLWCLHSLPPCLASNASPATGALLGEHPPRQPRQEGRSSGGHMGKVGHEVDLKDSQKQVILYVSVSLHTRRCDKLLFMSTVADERIGSIALPNITNGRASLWNKTKKVQWDIFHISLASSHYPRHLLMCGSTTETRQIGSSKQTTTLMSSWKIWSENVCVFLSQQCLFSGISWETTTVKCQSNLDTDSNTWG